LRHSGDELLKVVISTFKNNETRGSKQTTIQPTTNEANSHSTNHCRIKQPLNQSPTKQTAIQPTTNKSNSNSTDHQQIKHPFCQTQTKQTAIQPTTNESKNN
jgi:hypothetical protein